MDSYLADLATAGLSPTQMSGNSRERRTDQVMVLVFCVNVIVTDGWNVVLVIVYRFSLVLALLIMVVIVLVSVTLSLSVLVIMLVLC